MGWLQSFLVTLIILGLLAALFILAERARSKARRKSDGHGKEIIQADAERDYWWHG